MLRLVVGLGNPGSRYTASRHNVGFVALDALRADLGVGEPREKFSGLFARGDALGHTVAFLAPMTFMNLSGQSVAPASSFLKIAAPDVLVLHDELDLPFGDVRVKVGGGHAGHNGLRSLIEGLGTPGFVRVRIGVGRPPPGFPGDVADYVLSRFEGAECAALPSIVARAVFAAKEVIANGPEEAMNRVNPRPTQGGKRSPTS